MQRALASGKAEWVLRPTWHQDHLVVYAGGDDAIAECAINPWHITSLDQWDAGWRRKVIVLNIEDVRRWVEDPRCRNAENVRDVLARYDKLTEA